MKKFAYSTLAIITLVLCVFSCQKESLTPETTQAFQDGTEQQTPPVQLYLPDLIISDYSTTVTAKTLLCSAIIADTVPVGPIGLKADEPKLDKRVIIRPIDLRCPNVSCTGGQRSFTATVTIKNVGNRNLPAGNISVLWTDITYGSSQTQTVPHPGIPVGGTFQVSRPYFMGPCDCVPPPTYFKHLFKATVDPNNDIPEINNNNNMSKIYRACDGC